MTEGTLAPGATRLTVFGVTDPGRQREDNQDTFLAADLSVPGRDGGFRLSSLDGFPTEAPARSFDLGRKGSLLLVADGMGGAAGGQVASRMAATCVYEMLSGGWVPGPSSGPEAFRAQLVEAAEQANTRVHEWSLRHDQYRGMGSTLTLAGVLDDAVHLAQVGDSRAYLIRNGEPRQLTEDQTVVQQLLDAGALDEAEAERSPQRHVLLQALGPESRVQVATSSQQLRHGDVLLLCSDGLSGVLDAE
ncbi:MAG: PP2C family protein-serine/threonine phosphatase, partial [Gemmatimonadota bacterium]